MSLSNYFAERTAIKKKAELAAAIEENKRRVLVENALKEIKSIRFIISKPCGRWDQMIVYVQAKGLVFTTDLGRVGRLISGKIYCRLSPGSGGWWVARGLPVIFLRDKINAAQKELFGDYET